ncbi:ATP-dependent DNA helicase [Polaromonas sp. YR568]|uniref:ATP-dependent DNA helicase n=1 Tax=Polaromonas sp. YR568 TaxID=1855301 RepID=UPI0031382283
MPLASDVEAAFAPEGVLSRADEHFVPRQGQVDMALAVAAAIDDAHPLVVEASTGVGKTYAYLVPALLSGERVLLSTATKALQDQLFGRDLPRLVEILGLPTRTALLKGRASYLCLHRMTLARHEAQVSDATSLRALGRIEQWSQATRTGDLAELPGLDERSPLIPLVTSTRDNCLGSTCPQFRSCHVNLARREAMAADVVVINHHLFFADLSVRESGVAELLPSVRIAIFDEAHQLNETGIQFLGTQLSTGQLLDFCRDTLAAGLQLARGLVDWQAVVGAVEQAARHLRLCAGRQYPGTKLRWTGAAPEGLDDTEWSQALEAVHAACLKLCAALDTVSEMAPDFVRLHERGMVLAERSAGFLGAAEPGAVRWADVGVQLRLVESPMDISKTVKSKMLGASAEGESGKSWVFTSATLGDDERLTWFTGPCGLEDAAVLRVGSPFDYDRQACLYVPIDLPKPADPSHALRVAESAARWARQLGGRTMILTTTLRSLRTIGDSLKAALDDGGELQVLVQGDMPKRALIERFRSGSDNGEKGCVLVASASFWEGIDVPGEALQMVIIDKLPFPPPNDPLAEARARLLESQGRSAFSDYFLPEAAVALKQGAGRLIRRETDSGILVVCDSRLATMGYGKRLIKALPAMRRLTSEEELQAQIDALTRTCTKGCSVT